MLANSRSRLISADMLNGYLMRLLPHPRSCFFERRVLQREVRNALLQITRLPPQILDLIAAGGTVRQCCRHCAGPTRLRPIRGTDVRLDDRLTNIVITINMSGGGGVRLFVWLPIAPSASVIARQEQATGPCACRDAATRPDRRVACLAKVDACGGCGGCGGF